MRKVESFTLKFFLLPVNQGSRRAKIFLRIIVDRKKAEIFTGNIIETENWDSTKEQSKLKLDTAINEDLAELKVNIISIKRRLQYEDKTISAKLIKDIYIGNNSLKKFLLEYFNAHIQQISQLKKEYSKGTISNYCTTYKHLKAFLTNRKLKDILLTEVDSKFLNDFDFFLMTVTNVVTKNTMDRNTANKQHQRLKTVLLKAIREDYLEKNPYQNFKLKYNKTNREFLTDDEIESVKKHSLGNNPSLQKVRDIFLFSVYTGLRFGDAMKLESKHIRYLKNGKVWIEKIQEKTNENLSVPILKSAIEIIKKYDDDQRKITGYILPRISHQKVNAYLKVIAELTGISKNLTHHVARHTFATTIALSNNMPLELVSKLLGHTSTRTTQIYAKVTNKLLTEAIDKLDEYIK